MAPIFGLALMSTSSWKTAISSVGGSPSRALIFWQFGSTLRIFGSQHRPGPTPDEILLMHPASHRFAADLHAMILAQEHDDGVAAPAAAHKAEAQRRLQRDPTDQQRDPKTTKARPPRLNRLQGRQSLVGEPP